MAFRKQAHILLLAFTLLHIITKVSSSSSCEGRIMLFSGSVTESEKLTILNAHNVFRQQVALGAIAGQPQASNLQEMKWDDELADRAQQWTASCLSEEHDPDRHVSRFSVGQNIATIWTTKTPTTKSEVAADYKDAIKRWFNEYHNYQFQKVFQADNSIGHYTQMVWAESNLVGCGYSFYYDPAKGFTKNYICNYGPSGNVLGQYPYVPGQPSCETHNMQNSFTYAGLCENSQSSESALNNNRNDINRNSIDESPLLSQLLCSDNNFKYTALCGNTHKSNAHVHNLNQDLSYNSIHQLQYHQHQSQCLNGLCGKLLQQQKPQEFYYNIRNNNARNNIEQYQVVPAESPCSDERYKYTSLCANQQKSDKTEVYVYNYKGDEDSSTLLNLLENIVNNS